MEKVTTYKSLLVRLQSMTEAQLACNITVELGPEDECYPAELRYANEDHGSLDENHPIIFVP